MNIKLDVKKISSILSDFSELTKSDIFFYDAKLNLLSSNKPTDEKPCKALIECKKKKVPTKESSDAYIYIALPITKDGVIGAYLLLKSEEKHFKKLSDSEAQALNNLLAESLFSSTIAIELPYALKKAVGYINLNLSDDLSLAVLCNISHCSKNMLYKLFSDAFGCTVNDYIVEKRIETAKFLLETSKKSITDIGKSVGMPSNAHFCRAFVKSVGMSPSTYRKKYKDE